VSDKTDDIRKAIAGLEKTFGKGAIIRMGDRPSTRDPVAAISTGSLGLDVALGVGGIPRGRVVEVYGPESGGKTTLTLHLIAEAQKAGLTTAFVDAEHALDVDWARNLGVDVDDLYVSQPDHGEAALEIVDALVQTGHFGLIVIDSVAALTPKAELEGSMSDQQIGLQARLMSKGLRKITAAAAKSDTTVIFINQIRMRIGVMFGNPETTAGGKALRFYSSVRISVSGSKVVKDNGEPIGTTRTAKVVKNKVAAPFKTAVFDIMFGGEHGYGIEPYREMLTLAEDCGVIEKSGPWYAYGGEKLGRGRTAARQFLSENPSVAKEIRAKVVEAAL